MDQISITAYPCKFHNDKHLEYICMSQSCYYSQNMIETSDKDGCKSKQYLSRISCRQCIDDYHSYKCDANTCMEISQSFKMPSNFDSICQKIVDRSEENKNLIEVIDTMFEQLKIQFINKVDAEKKNIMRDITQLNTDIFEFNYKIQKKWNFSAPFYSWLQELAFKDIQDKENESSLLEEVIQKCHRLTEKIALQFKNSSTSFQIFTNIEKQIMEMKEKLNKMFEELEIQRRSELSKSQEFRFVTECRHIDTSPNLEGYQIIRNSKQSYFDCYSSVELIHNKTYQVLFSFDKALSNSVSVGLVNTEGLADSRVEKRISQSLVYSYNKYMGNVQKGEPLYSLIKPNEIYKIVINLRDNIFYISDDNESNVISLAKGYILSKGIYLQAGTKQSQDYLTNPNLFEDIKWRLFFSFNEPIMNVKIIKSIIY